MLAPTFCRKKIGVLSKIRDLLTFWSDRGQELRHFWHREPALLHPHRFLVQDSLAKGQEFSFFIFCLVKSRLQDISKQVLPFSSWCSWDTAPLLSTCVHWTWWKEMPLLEKTIYLRAALKNYRFCKLQVFSTFGWEKEKLERRDWIRMWRSVVTAVQNPTEHDWYYQFPPTVGNCWFLKKQITTAKLSMV